MTKQIFFDSAKTITHRMIKQGGSKIKITNTLKKTYGQHFVIFGTFAPTSKVFVDTIFSYI